MNIKSRGKKLVNSFKYAFNGFKLTFKNEQNMVIHINKLVMIYML